MAVLAVAGVAHALAKHTRASLRHHRQQSRDASSTRTNAMHPHTLPRPSADNRRAAR